MSETYEHEITPEQQPSAEDVSYDLERVLSSVLSIKSEIPEDAFTASILGTERAGHGFLIDDNGLVVTIGYLITEAETVWLVDGSGHAAAAHVVGVDQETGFGLVQAMEPLNAPVIDIGSSFDLGQGDEVIVAGHGGRRRSIKAEVIAKREFAGYWEYVLDEAIFTTPPHPFWGGSALIGEDGTLRGIGSLFLQQVMRSGSPFDGNMMVPIDILQPVLDDLVKYGRPSKPPRPWLGMFTMEAENKLVVTGLATGGPAHQADIRVGDLVLGVDGNPVNELASMYRTVWARGEPGIGVPMTILREGAPMEVTVRTGNRADFLKSPQLH